MKAFLVALSLLVLLGAQQMRSHPAMADGWQLWSDGAYLDQVLAFNLSKSGRHEAGDSTPAGRSPPARLAKPTHQSRHHAASAAPAPSPSKASTRQCSRTPSSG